MPLRVSGAQRQKAREGVGLQKVCAERKDDIGVFEPVLRVHVLAEGRFGGGARAVAVHRLPLNEPGLRVLGLNSLPLRGERGGSDGAGQEDQAIATLHRLDLLQEGRLEILELGVDALSARSIDHVLGAVGIVQIQQRGLGKEDGEQG